MGYKLIVGSVERMWGKQKIEFTACPMYHRSHANGTKLTQLEADMHSITNGLTKLNVEQSEVMRNQVDMKAEVKEFRLALEAHMEDEVEHHSNTSKAMHSLADSVKDLVTDNKEHRKLREKLEIETSKKQDDWRKLWFRIGGSMLLVIILAIGGFVWTSLDYYTTARQAQKVQKEILHNQNKFIDHENYEVPR